MHRSSSKNTGAVLLSETQLARSVPRNRPKRQSWKEEAAAAFHLTAGGQVDFLFSLAVLALGSARQLV
jgi:hypothetical protein